MERDVALEEILDKALNQLEMAKKELYTDPKLALKLIFRVKDSLQGVYVKIAKKLKTASKN